MDRVTRRPRVVLRYRVPILNLRLLLRRTEGTTSTRCAGREQTCSCSHSARADGDRQTTPAAVGSRCWTRRAWGPAGHQNLLLHHPQTTPRQAYPPPPGPSDHHSPRDPAYHSSNRDGQGQRRIERSPLLTPPTPGLLRNEHPGFHAYPPSANGASPRGPPHGPPPPRCPLLWDDPARE